MSFFLFLEGHALTKRFSKQISQVTKNLHTAVDDFNNLDCTAHRPLLRSLKVDEVKNPEADLWLCTEFLGSSSLVPISVRRKSVDLYRICSIKARKKSHYSMLAWRMSITGASTARFFPHHWHRRHITRRLSGILREGCSCHYCFKNLILYSCIICFIHEISLRSFVFDKEDLPLIDDSEKGEETGAFLSRPEHVCARQREWESTFSSSVWIVMQVVFL